MFLSSVASPRIAELGFAEAGPSLSGLPAFFPSYLNKDEPALQGNFEATVEKAVLFAGFRV